MIFRQIYERHHNPTLSIVSEEEFVAASLAQLGPQPPNFQLALHVVDGGIPTWRSLGSRREPSRPTANAAV